MKKWSVAARKRCDPRGDSASLATMQWEASTDWGICSCVNWSPFATQLYCLSYLYFVSYFWGLTSAGSISQAPEWPAFQRDLANGWYWWAIGGQAGRKPPGCFSFSSLSALKRFSGSGCLFSSFPVPSGQVCHLVSYCHLTLTFEIWWYPLFPSFPQSRKGRGFLMLIPNFLTSLDSNC